jgi:Uma2 family endonuclease
VNIEEYLHSSLVRTLHECVEILSPDDSATEIRTKVDEYFALGVPYVWIVDPTTFDGEIHTSDGIERVRDGRFRAGDITVDLRAPR